MRQARIIIADDHPGVLEDIRDLLEPEFDVVRTVGDGDLLVSAVDELKPDVIITDVSMPRMSGIEAARRIVQKDPQSRIILLTVHDDAAIVAQGLAAGALGYVIKEKAGRDLADAVRSVLPGNPYISAHMKYEKHRQ